MYTHNIDLAKTEDYLLNLLPRAGQILRRFFRAETLTYKAKGKLDFVTSADLAVDKFLISELKINFSDIPILTEETAVSDFRNLVKEDLIWVVDPLDGTSNFARGDPNFSISVALVSNGLPLIGVLFIPVSGRMFWARRDKEGAYGNGRRIHVSKVYNINESTVCTDWSHILETRDQTTDFLRKVFGSVRQIKILGSAATDISLLARGEVDIYHHIHLMPWDIGAAALIAEKAGAIVTDSGGGIWNVFVPDILAANKELHPKILNLIKA